MAGAAHDRVEDRLFLRGGAGDHTEDLGGRRLLIKGHREIAVACLQLFEKAHVLDGDHGLIGKGFEERDVRV